MERSNPSVIWERPELWVHSNRAVLLSILGGCCRSMLTGGDHLRMVNENILSLVGIRLCKDGRRKIQGHRGSLSRGAIDFHAAAMGCHEMFDYG